MIMVRKNKKESIRTIRKLENALFIILKETSIKNKVLSMIYLMDISQFFFQMGTNTYVETT